MRNETISNDFIPSCFGLIASLAALAVASGAGAQAVCPSFPVAASFATRSEFNHSVAVADLDGDGVPDLVTAGGFVSVLLGNGDGSFQAAVSVETGDNAYSAAVADLDADGVPDLVTTNSDGLSVLLGNGDGSFQAAVSFPLQGRGPVSVADLNGDGAPDLVAASHTDVSVLLGNGDGSFKAAVSSPLDGRGPLSVADLDGDGVPDLVAASHIGVSVLLGNGDGSFQPGVYFPAGHQALALAVADLDRDSIPDIVSAGGASDIHGIKGVSVQLGNGDGSFRAATSFATGGPVNSVAVADLDGDDIPDVVTTKEFGDGVSVLLGNGDGSFRAPVYFSTGNPRGSEAVAVADLDADVVPDIVTSNNGEFPSYGDVRVLLGNGDGTFQATTSFPTESGPVAVAVADFDGDTIPDLVTANSLSKYLSVLMGKGDGSFRGAVPLEVGNQPTAVAVADLDGDGAPDLVATHYYYPYPPPGVVVLLGNGDGTFQAATPVDAGGGAFGVAIADLDGDSVPDIVTASVDGNAGVLLGYGDGSFQAPVFFPMDIGDKFVAVADFDGDGVPDIVAAGSGSNVKVLRGNGDGSFQAAVLFPAGENAHTVAVADLDGDRVPDLVTANYGPSYPYDGDLSVLLGNGDGSFQAPASFAAGSGHRFVAVGDLDGDGVPDLVTTGGIIGTVTGTVSVLLGNGDGSFQAAKSFPTDGAPYFVAVSDFDGDRVLDVVTANRSSDSVTVLVNQCDPPALLVDLDIKPGSDPNPINPSVTGVFPVAILGSESFDVFDVDGKTLRFGSNGASLAHWRGPHYEDVNGDGVTDLLAHFRVEDTGIQFGDRMACLEGETLDGQRFKGCDSIRTVPDIDGDSLLDVDETAIGTNALRFDSDGDGYGDGTEVLLMGTDPLDPLDPKPVADRERRAGHKRRR